MIDKPTEMTGMKDRDLPILNEIIGAICNKAATITYTNVLPTATTVPSGTLVVYHGTDDTKRLYMLTGQLTSTGTLGVPILGYVTLTV